MLTRLLDFRISTLVFGRDVGDFPCDFHQFLAAVVWLDHDGFVCLGDVMLKAYHVSQSHGPADFVAGADGVVVHGVGEIKTYQAGCAIIAGQHPCRHECPEHSKRVIIAHVH